tara:strand:+ start:299 stop:748 length:450 start_codon:yes stop_codon:yes gene_type:complete
MNLQVEHHLVKIYAMIALRCARIKRRSKATPVGLVWQTAKRGIIKRNPYMTRVPTDNGFIHFQIVEHLQYSMGNSNPEFAGGHDHDCVKNKCVSHCTVCGGNSWVDWRASRPLRRTLITECENCGNVSTMDKEKREIDPKGTWHRRESL